MSRSDRSLRPAAPAGLAIHLHSAAAGAKLPDPPMGFLALAAANAPTSGRIIA